MIFKRYSAYLFCLMALAGLSGCMTVGYSTAKDSNMVRKWDVTIIEIEPQNIYNAMGVALVGPFASVEHKGQKITFLDSTGAKASIVQPISNRYELHPAEKAVFIVDRGQVWVQPTDYPLPPEFNAAPASLPAAQSAPKSEAKALDVPSSNPAQQPAPKPEAKALDAASSNQAPTQHTNATQKLRELNALYKEGLIEKSDYETKKQAILNAM